MTTTLTKCETRKQNGNEKVCVRVYRPRFDIRETDDELLLYGDLPGVEADDVDIQFENRELTIKGPVSSARGEVTFLHKEYGIGEFRRSFAVTESIDVAKISAELKDGVLTIHLPKKEEVKPQRIRVKA